MKQKWFDEAQIIGILKQQESGVTVAQICREHAISEGTFYRWKSKYGGMEVHEAALAPTGTGKRPAQEVAGGVDARQCGSQGCASKKW